jgi:hypothetical protein
VVQLGPGGVRPHWQRRKKRACLLLQGSIGTFPFTRLGPRESALECRKSAHLPTRKRELRQPVFVPERVNELNFEVLANSDAGLRCLDSATADALPCLDVFIPCRPVASPVIPGTSVRKYRIALRASLGFRLIHRVDGEDRMRTGTAGSRSSAPGGA